MLKAVKKEHRFVKAYRLSDRGDMIETLIREGRIKERDDGNFEVFSREAVHGIGEVAAPDDFIKLDSEGYPYPNSAEFFLSNHIKVDGTTYEQIPRPIDIWTAQEPVCEEILFLIKEKGLVINESDPDRYFNAHLWGSDLSAGKDAIIAFYSLERNEQGDILDVDYNFIDRNEFDRIYRLIPT